MTRHPVQGNNDHADRHEHPQRPIDTTTPNSAADQTETDAAWMKMQTLLAAETPHPSWQAWAERDHAVSASATSVPETATTSTPKGLNMMNHPSPAAPEQHNRTKSRRFSSKARKWTTGIAACVVAGAVLATPFGNNALASLLNQFRMQELTAVNDEGISDMLTQYQQKGVTSEDINRFGVFSSSNGSYEGEHTADEATSKLGYSSIPKSALSPEQNRVYVNPSHTETYKLNTEAVNSAITRLGGTMLLPEEMNGKLITLTMPATISYTLEQNDDVWMNLDQMDVPNVTFDEGVDAARVFETISNLPLMPQDVKDMLQKEKILKGELPLPILSNAPSERVQVNNIPVVIQTQQYGDVDMNTAQTEYSAYWIKDGELFTLRGNDKAFTGSSDVAAKVKELTAS
ncbi:hypothetical protein ACE3MZ_05135 [Paenibacillus sp. WLX1005]|uniref:hypothetical protein n=1 Tax=Paenibacillus sp. WLX1005 TaxID=3243766 RepID=UPI0039843934